VAPVIARMMESFGCIWQFTTYGFSKPGDTQLPVRSCAQMMEHSYSQSSVLVPCILSCVKRGRVLGGPGRKWMARLAGKAQKAEVVPDGYRAAKCRIRKPVPVNNNDS
jgi:hypothetical protein